MAEATPPVQARRLKGAALAALIAATVASVAPALTEPNEGLRAKPYLDPSRILTVCYGETQGIEDRIYSHDACAARLRLRMARDYAPSLIACVPGFAEPQRRWAFGAALDAAYNAGPEAFCRSPAAMAFRAGSPATSWWGKDNAPETNSWWTEGCMRLVGWHIEARVDGRLTVLPGLERRRREEALYCLTGRRG